MQEYLAELVKRGVIDCSIDNSFTDSMKIREIRWAARMGSTMQSRVEYELGPDGRVGAWKADRYLIVTHEVNQVTDPTGRKETVDCNNTTEFVPAGNDVTEIISIHHHQNIESRWYQRLLPPTAARGTMKRRLAVQASRCEKALRVGAGD
jgi:hypothetical protein